MNKKSSHTGTRTRVGWVKTSYPNHLDYMGMGVRKGTEPLKKPSDLKDQVLSHQARIFKWINISNHPLTS